MADARLTYQSVVASLASRSCGVCLAPIEQWRSFATATKKGKPGVLSVVETQCPDHFVRAWKRGE